MEDEINKALNKAKSAIFLNSNSAFLGSLICNCKISMTEDVATACVGGNHMKFNPDFFMSLSPEGRKTLIMHEIWHIARLHALRCNGRDHETWNEACDYVINNGLIADKFDVKALGGLCGKYEGKSEEEIYDILISKKQGQGKNAQGQDNQDTQGQDSQGQNTSSPGSSLAKDITFDVSDAEKSATVQAVLQADQNVKSLGLESFYGSQSMIAAREFLNDFIESKVPWQTVLKRYLKCISANCKRTWQMPNRRYQNMYLPGTKKKRNSLAHLMYFLDVSGSITKKEAQTFVSEIRYVKNTFNPKLMTVCQFDTEILETKLYQDKDKFNDFDLISGMGTSYEKIHELIEEKKPDCAIIFTDLEAKPMAETSVPVLWITDKANGQAWVKTGEVIEVL